MNDAVIADLRAALDAAQRDNAALRADIAQLCAMLREVRYVMTVGDINRYRMTADRMDARWSNATNGSAPCATR